ncbi:MAG: cytochrome c1 [Proteobacteria bacterium]|nr:cytochrome c1 [Pseudomonadota bacterium]
MLKLNTVARFIVVAACLVATQSVAIGASEIQLQEANIDPENIASLQRGARNFMNYCSGCHSAQYVRYKTIGKYLELSEDQLIDNLMFNAANTFETINVAMPADSAERWFGKTPPDLSLRARAKGADYIYSFLKGFYVDPNSPTGVDNIVLSGTSMPHILWELQGFQAAIYSENIVDSVTSLEFEGFEQVTAGSMNAEEYDDFVRDTVNFLAYITEPIRSERRRLGVWVLMFLLFFLIIATMLKKQIWKDVS